jgi:hypothetical protein
MVFAGHEHTILVRGLLAYAPVELDKIRGLSESKLIADLLYRPVCIMKKPAGLQVDAGFQYPGCRLAGYFFTDPVELFGTDMDLRRIGLNVPGIPEIPVDEFYEFVIAGIVVFEEGSRSGRKLLEFR